MDSVRSKHVPIMLCAFPRLLDETSRALHLTGLTWQEGGEARVMKEAKGEGTIAALDVDAFSGKHCSEIRLFLAALTSIALDLSSVYVAQGHSFHQSRAGSCQGPPSFPIRIRYQDTICSQPATLCPQPRRESWRRDQWPVQYRRQMPSLASVESSRLA